MSTVTETATALNGYGLWAEADVDANVVIVTLTPRSAAALLDLLEDEVQGVRR